MGINSASESVLEDLWWHMASKCRELPPGVAQYRVGRWRIDAAYTINTRVIGIELDGKTYHDYERDKERDMAILATGEVHEIIRIPFAALEYFTHATMKMLSYWHSEFNLPDHLWVFSIEEWDNQIRKVERDIWEWGNGGQSIDQFIDECDGTYSIWHADEHSGFVCGPKSYANDWKKHIIERRTATADGVGG